MRRKTPCPLPVAIFAVRRMDVQFEQRVNIKFCVKLGKTATETLQLLPDAYGDEALSRVRVFEWHRRFVLGRVSVEDDTSSGRPSSLRNEDNVVRIRHDNETVLLQCAGWLMPCISISRPATKFCGRTWVNEN